MDSNQREQLKTYRGVYLDINKSDICALYAGVYFYFCSKPMKEKFINNVEDFINKHKKRIQYVIPDIDLSNIDIALAVQYYIYVEKRGYRIETMHGVKIRRGHLIGDVEFAEIKGE